MWAYIHQLTIINLFPKSFFPSTKYPYPELFLAILYHITSWNHFPSTLSHMTTQNHFPYVLYHITIQNHFHWLHTHHYPEQFPLTLYDITSQNHFPLTFYRINIGEWLGITTLIKVFDDQNTQAISHHIEKTIICTIQVHIHAFKYFINQSIRVTLRQFTSSFSTHSLFHFNPLLFI